MRNRTKWDSNISKHRQEFIEKGFELFSSKSIETVKLEEVAAASGHGVATLYRYFGTKAGLLVEISAWKWGEFFRENRKRRPQENLADMSAADMFDFYLDSYLEVYRQQKALLRFNQLFNIYLQTEAVDRETVGRYQALMQPIQDFFHVMYEKAKEDGTLRTDISEGEMFTSTIHLMLAVVTRYAVGLVYQPAEGFDDLKELTLQKELLKREYVVSP